VNEIAEKYVKALGKDNKDFHFNPNCPDFPTKNDIRVVFDHKPKYVTICSKCATLK
jgi:hypothetical protein